MIEAVVSLLVLCGLLILGVPMVVALISAVALDLWLTGAWASTLPQMMISGMSRFVLLALPLFVLAGGVMNAGGISARLFEFARAPWWARSAAGSPTSTWSPRCSSAA
jgi:TRAP-type mannitol/chloroaromatic compound transport system permease large subunit